MDLLERERKRLSEIELDLDSRLRRPDLSDTQFNALAKLRQECHTRRIKVEFMMRHPEWR